MTSPQPPNQFQGQGPALPAPQAGQVTQPDPGRQRMSRQARKLEMRTRELTDASAALARKLRGDLMLSILQPLLTQQPARIVAARFLTAMDHLNINAEEQNEAVLWQPPSREAWSKDLPANDPSIPMWERLRRLGRNKPDPDKSDPVVEWEICYAINRWVNDNVPGDTIAEKKENARSLTGNLTLAELESNMHLGTDFPREWSIAKWWDEQLYRRGQGGINDPRAAYHDWDHPGLTASRVVRTDVARQLLQKGGIELGIVGGSEALGQRPPSAARWRQIFSGNAERLQNANQRQNLSLAQTLIDWGIDKDGQGIDKTAEARLATKVGKYRARFKEIQERIDRAQSGPNSTNPNTENLRTDRLGEIMTAIGGLGPVAWYMGQLMNRTDLMGFGVVGSIVAVAGTTLKYGMRGIRGLREKGLPPKLANRRKNRTEKSHDEALDRLYLSNAPDAREPRRGQHRRK